MTNRKYILVAVVKNGDRIPVSRVDSPMTHEQACTMKSEFNHHKSRHIEIEELGVIAINKKYQSRINRFLKWNTKYDSIVDFNAEHDIEDCIKQEKAFNKAYDLFLDLPERECANIKKSTSITGY